MVVAGYCCAHVRFLKINYLCISSRYRTIINCPSNFCNMIHKDRWRWLDHGLSVKVFCESGLWLSLFLGVFWHHIWPRLLHLWLVGDISGLHRSYFRGHLISNCLSNDFWEGLFEYRKIFSFLFKILMQSLMEIWINCKARLLKGQFTSDIKVQSLFIL